MAAEQSEYNRNRFARVRMMELVAGVSARIASPEDLIIAKLAYDQQGGSDKHVRNISRGNCLFPGFAGWFYSDVQELPMKRVVYNPTFVTDERWRPFSCLYYHLMKVHYFGIIAVFLLSSVAGGQLRVINYNIAHRSGDQTALQEVFATLNGDDAGGYAIAPHVYVFQEVRQGDASALLSMLNAAAPPGIEYDIATFTITPFENDSAGAQALCYRIDTLIEEPSGHVDLATGAGRFSDRWRLNLLGYDSFDAGFYIYSSHLKASPGEDNEAERLQGVMTIRGDADALGPDAHIIYAGDFNFHHSGETGYMEFLSAGPGQAFDPLGNRSWSGPGQAIKHTQSPRATGLGDLVGGGLDDRFDFQLATMPFQDDDGLSHLSGAYRGVGNDGLHYNNSINDGNNSYFPNDSADSNALADALHIASDHIPLLAEYQLPAKMAGDLTEDFGRIIQSAEIDVTLQVTNPVEATTPSGVDVLDYTATTSGILSGTVSDQVGPLPESNIHTFPVDTSQAAEAIGQVQLTTSSEGAQPGELIFQTVGTVLRPSNPSFSETVDVNTFETDWVLEVDNGVQAIQVDLYNFGFDQMQATMDFDFVSNLELPFGLAGGPRSNIGERPATIEFTFDTDGVSPGDYAGDFTILTSDEDVPGETSDSVTLSLNVSVTDDSVFGDLNDDGIVNGADLGGLLGSWGMCDGCSADLNGDGVVNGADLGALLGAWSR